MPPSAVCVIMNDHDLADLLSCAVAVYEVSHWYALLRSILFSYSILYTRVDYMLHVVIGLIVVLNEMDAERGCHIVNSVSHGCFVILSNGRVAVSTVQQ